MYFRRVIPFAEFNHERFGVKTMKKLYAVLLALVLMFAMATVAMAYESPVAPTYDGYHGGATTTARPTPTTKPFVRPTAYPNSPGTPGGNVDDADRNTTGSGGSHGGATAKPDTNPSSPQTGSFTESAGKVAVATGTVLLLAAAVVYTSKKKVTE